MFNFVLKENNNIIRKPNAYIVKRQNLQAKIKKILSN